MTKPREKTREELQAEIDIIMETRKGAALSYAPENRKNL